MDCTKIIGILNVTPDSFSDGGDFISHSAAIERARELVQDGADFIEIGGDSTRPGSVCVGPEEEWRRISALVSEISKFCPVSVDTHHSEVAHSALVAGASMINDISGGDPKILALIAKHQKKIVLMSSTSKPHDFSHMKEKGLDVKGNSDSDLQIYMGKLSAMASMALKAGVRREDVILDPGMGAFLTPDPNRAWELVYNFQKFESLNYALCFAASRKGFLRSPATDSPVDRDGVSALVGILTALRHKDRHPLYLRVHNVKLQRAWLERAMNR